MNKKLMISLLITSLVVAGSILAVSGLPGCKTVQTSETSPGDNNTPTSHNVNEGGVLHMPGLNNPEPNCTQCHGSDLRGAETVPSCYSCHGKKW